MEGPLLSSHLDDDIREVVTGIFENMLQLSLNVERTSAEITGGWMMASLQFTGSWDGKVSLSCESGKARQLAARFLALPVEELADQLVADVIGEMVNMIAGNLKSVFAADIRLSLPTTTLCSSDTVNCFVHGISHMVHFTSSEGPFQVAVVASPKGGRELWAQFL